MCRNLAHSARRREQPESAAFWEGVECGLDEVAAGPEPESFVAGGAEGEEEEEYEKPRWKGRKGLDPDA